MRNAIFILLATGMVMAGPSARPTMAQHAGHGGTPTSTWPESAPWSGKEKGKVTELTKTSITIEKQKKRSTETVTYLMNDRIEVKGELAVGSEVVIHYRQQSGIKTVTRIEVKKSQQKESSQKQ